jgi:hypothetical protein
MAILLFVNNNGGTCELVDVNGVRVGDVHVQPGDKVKWEMNGTGGDFEFTNGKPFGVDSMHLGDTESQKLTVSKNAAKGRYEYEIICDHGDDVVDSPPRVIVD